MLILTLLAAVAVGALVGVALVRFRRRDPFDFPLAGAAGGLVAGAALGVWAEVWPGRYPDINFFAPWLFGPAIGAAVGAAAGAARRAWRARQGAGRRADRSHAADLSDQGHR